MRNITKEIKTTIVGSILFLLGVGIFTYEYLTEKTLDWGHYALPAAITAIGVLLLLAPDKLINMTFRKINKKV